MILRLLSIGVFCLLQASAVYSQAVISVVKVKSLGGSALINYPVTLGHTFVKGDAPSGISVKQGATTLPTQMNVKTRHSDGSVNHAILSFMLPTLAGNGQADLELVTSALNSATPALTKTQILATDFDAVVTFVKGGQTYTVSARDLLNAAATPEMWLDGPVVREFLLAGVPKTAGNVSDSALRVQFQVRFYDLNRAWVSVVVENVWAMYRKNITYDVTVRLGRTSQTTALTQTGVTQYYDSRWRRTFWWGTNPGTVETHLSMPYLSRTGAIPRYDSTIVVNATVSYGDTTLMGNGTIMRAFGTTGGREDIGLYPAWTARYLCSFKNAYWKQMVINGQQGASCPVHIRDNASQKIYDIDAHPTVTLNTSARQWSNRNDTLPIASGTTPWGVDDAHQPSLDFIPYLVSGEYFFLEELYFWANFNFYSQNYAYRGNDSCLLVNLQVRGTAWTLRTLVDAAFIAPDGSWEKSYFVDKVNHNLKWCVDKMVPSHPLGMWGNISNWGSDGGRPDANMRGDVRYFISPWQSDFLAISFDHALDIGFTQARASRDWLAKNTIGRFANSPAYNPFDGAPYHMASKDTAGRSYTSWGEIWQASFAGRTTPAPTTLSDLDCVHGYEYIARAALTGAVRDTLTNAATAWAFVSPKLSGACWSTSPTWAFVPGTPHNNVYNGNETDADAGPTLSLSASPNPFNPDVTLNLSGVKAGLKASLRIYDVKGRQVADLTERLQAGRALIWNAKGCPSGFYMVRVMAGSKQLTKKLVLAK